jgi:hypothetical protein
MADNNSTQPRIFEKPVAWLLGKQLLNSLKGILLYSAYGGKIDPRDWMTGKAFRYAKQGSDWICEPLPTQSVAPELSGSDEFWFDYLSDTGDGTKAVYSLVYLAMGSLWTNLTSTTTNLHSTTLDLNVSFSNDGKSFELPRGEFLFIGGDTAYHAAEYMTLANRIQRPFRYAYEDRRSHQLISDDDPRKNLFGIPGNHDYYDQLDGFRRQFRKPTRPEGPLPPKQSGPRNAQLSVPAYQRIQEASYVALSLPFGWWLWAFDLESAVSDRHKVNIDRRQKGFFQALSLENGKFKEPDKLIVATCAPSTVFGRLADPKDPKVAAALKDVGVERLFLSADDERVVSGTGDVKLAKGQCRLDLSGDVHHYARYWGPDAGAASRDKSTAGKASANSYASVVSGAGGAFHHPTPTYDDEICEQVLYPTEAKSRAAVAKSIFKFWNVWTGGRVWLFGLIIAFTIYFGAVGPTSSRQFISNFPYLADLGLTKRETIKPTVIKLTSVDFENPSCKDVTPFRLWRMLGIADETWPAPRGCRANDRTYFFATASWPKDLILGQVLVWISFFAIVATLVVCAFTDKIFSNRSPFDKHHDPARKLWPIIIATTTLVVLGLLTLFPYRDYLTPFASSLLVLYSIFGAATAIVLSLRYGEYRYKKSFVPDGGSDPYLQITCWVLAVVVVGFALSFFGQNNLPSFLVSDMIFVTVLLSTCVAIILLPFKAAADLLYTKPGIVAFIGKLLIGLWHLALQLFVPYVLIHNGNYVVWIIAAVLLFVFIIPGQISLKNNWRMGLSLTWVVFGSLMLLLPALVKAVMGEHYQPVFQNTTGWLGLVPALIAGAVGAIICCLWTGWYFGVCFAFNGHNNEVGGAARIEQFKEFVRFRLTAKGLTGYVIAVDDVEQIGTTRNGRVQDGSDLKPKIIDVFHLVPKP